MMDDLPENEAQKRAREVAHRMLTTPKKKQPKPIANPKNSEVKDSKPSGGRRPKST
jgi:hypothetical protein